MYVKTNLLFIQISSTKVSFVFTADVTSCLTKTFVDEVAEWLRRWTANPLGSARVGSNPIFVAFSSRFYGVMVSTLDFESSDPSSNLGRTLNVEHLST